MPKPRARQRGFDVIERERPRPRHDSYSDEYYDSASPAEPYENNEISFDEAGDKATSSDKVTKHITISDDRSAGSNLEARNLAALKNAGNNLEAQSELRSWRALGIGDWDNDDVVELIEEDSYYSTRRNFQPSNGPSSRRAQMQQRFGQLRLGDGIPSEKDRVSDTKQTGATSEDVPAAKSSSKGKKKRVDFVDKTAWAGDAQEQDPGDSLRTEIESLQRKVIKMQQELREVEMQSQMSSKKFQFLYRLDGKCYLDHPEWTQGQNSIICRKLLNNFELFLERNKNIAFVVYRDFGDGSSVPKPKDVASPPEHIAESIRLIDKRLLKFFETLLERNWRYNDDLGELRHSGEIKAPYLFIYHHRKYWKSLLSHCRSTVREHASLLTNYVSQNFGEEYEAADASFSQRKVSVEHVKYLFQPGDILVTKSAGKYRGVVASSWPGDSATVPTDAENDEDINLEKDDAEFFPSEPDDTDLERTDTDEDVKRYNILAAAMSNYPIFGKHDAAHGGFKKNNRGKATSKRTMAHVFGIRVCKWSFDGEFKREADTHSLRLSPGSSGEQKEWVLHDLEIYPLRFAPESIVNQLRRRGEMLWMCRKRSIVSYRETVPGAQEEVSIFVVDILLCYVLMIVLTL